MKKILYAVAAATAVLALLSACSKPAASTQKPVTLHYSAAASLQTSLTKVAKTYQAQHPRVHIDFDYAGSGAIREKVIAGAPIDGVFLASKSDADKLVAAHKLTAPKKTLTNTLTAIANVKNATIPENSQVASQAQLKTLISQAKKIAIGQPATVPAGMYATQTLSALSESAAAQPKLVEASDVTQALSYVAAGNADLGFVYRTDAATNKQVKVVATVPESLHDPILYYSGTVTGSKHTTATKAFNAYLTTAKAQKVFVSYGFGTTINK